jgi:hypothetical protein
VVEDGDEQCAGDEDAAEGEAEADGVVLAAVGFAEEGPAACGGRGYMRDGMLVRVAD